MYSDPNEYKHNGNEPGLDPCFSGMYRDFEYEWWSTVWPNVLILVLVECTVTITLVNNSEGAVVLILVLVECTVTGRKGAAPRALNSLDPCFSGKDAICQRTVTV